MQEAKRFAFDVGITFIASVVTMLLGFVITVALGRYLGAGDLGLYRMTSTIYGIAMLFAAIGIPGTIIKYVAEFKDKRQNLNEIVSSGIITSLFLGIGFTVLFYFSSGLFAEIFEMPKLSDLLKILSPVFPFALVNGALLGLLNGLRKMKKYGISTIFQSILMITITVPLIYYGFGVSGAIIGIVFSSIGYCLLLIWVTRNYFDIDLYKIIPTTKMILAFSSRKFGANVINLINYQADILLIGYFLTTTDVGYYAVAISLSRFFWLIPNAIQKITYPVTSEYWAKKNYKALNKMIDKSMKHTACILLPIGLVTGFFARDIIISIFGEAFIHSVLPLQILLIGTIIAGATTRSVGASMPAIGRPGLNLGVTAISASINIILNLILIPPFGIVGAAIATTCSLSIHAILMLFLIATKVSVKIDFGWYEKLSLLAFFSILSFYFFRYINCYVVGGIVILLFSVGTWLFFLSKEDKVFFINLIKTL